MWSSTIRLFQADTIPFEDAVSDADAVIVATNHSAFRTPQALARSLPGAPRAA